MTSTLLGCCKAVSFTRGNALLRRNWASGARWSACVATFRTYPDPNIDPIGYLKVGV